MSDNKFDQFIEPTLGDSTEPFEIEVLDGISASGDFLKSSKNKKFKSSVMVGWPGIIIEREEERELLRKKLWEYSMIPIFFEKEFIERVIDNSLYKMLRPLLLDYIYTDNSDVNLEEGWKDLVDFHEIYAEQLVKSSVKQKLSFFVILDYEIIMLGNYIRKPLVDSIEGNCIGLNLDTNFTTYSVLKLFPFSKQIIQSLICLDVITFPNLSHIEGFIDITKTMFEVEFKLERGVMYLEIMGRLIVLRTGGVIVANDLIKKVTSENHYQQVLSKVQMQVKNKYIMCGFDSPSNYDGILIKLKAIINFVKKNQKLFNGKKVRYVQIVNTSYSEYRFSKIRQM